MGTRASVFPAVGASVFGSVPGIGAYQGGAVSITPFSRQSQLTHTGTTTAHSLAIPGTVLAGDLLVAFFTARANVTHTWGTFTVGEAPGADAVLDSSWAYKIAAGGETTETVTTSLSRAGTGVVYRIATGGWHGTTAPTASTIVYSPAGGNPGAVAGMVGWAAPYLYIAGINWYYTTNPTTTFDVPSGFTQDGGSHDFGVSNLGTAHGSLESATINLDAGAFTLSPADSNRSSVVIAVRGAV